MPLNIVLVEPLIPQNTGSIGRLTAATGSKLHLIEPLGFELSDKYLKRAGLDYWSEIDLTVYKNWEDFLSQTVCREDNLWIFTTHATRSYHQVHYGEDDFLVFGNESSGLAKSFHERYETRRLRIPQDNPRVRSINLANAASVVLYEGRRQLGLLD